MRCHSRASSRAKDVSGKIGIAILAYFLYSQLLVAARTWVESQIAPAIIGLWWVHAIALCVGLWLLVEKSSSTCATGDCMSILSRYVVRAVLIHTLLVVSVLLVLGGLVDLIYLSRTRSASGPTE